MSSVLSPDHGLDYRTVESVLLVQPQNKVRMVLSQSADNFFFLTNKGIILKASGRCVSGFLIRTDNWYGLTSLGGID